MAETLRRLESGDLEEQPQDDAQATFAPILNKEDGRIDWNLPALEVWNRIRGLRPWPGAYTTFRGKNLHIWAASRPNTGETTTFNPGMLVAERGRLRVACGDGTLLEAREIQLEGRKRMPVRDFLNGVKLAPTETLGGLTSNQCT